MTTPDSILLVTGQIAEAKACTQSLQRAGYRVLTVPGAAAAINTLKAGAADFVVLNPPLSPAVSVAEFSRLLHGAGSEIPVLLLIDPADADGMREGLEAGAREVLRKTAGFAELLPEAVGRVRRLNELDRVGRRARTETEILRRSSKAVHAVAKTVSRGDGIDRILAGAAEQMIAVHGLSWVTLWLAENGNGPLRCRVNTRLSASGRLSNPSLPPPVDPASLVLEEGRLLANDLDQDPRFPPAWVSVEGVRGFVALELAGPQGRLGLITACSTQPIRDQTAEALEPMAALLTLAVQSHLDTQSEQRQRTRMQATLESMNSGLIGFDPAGRITYASTAAGEALGRPGGALVGMTLGEALYGAADSRRPDEFQQVIISGWPISREQDGFVRADGTPLSVAYKVFPLTEAGSRVGGIIAFRDVTEQLRAQSQENAARRLYQTLVEQSPDLVIW